MKMPDEFKDWTLKELLERRLEILARPFPQGYSGEERRMMEAVEEYCTIHFMEALEFIKNWQRACVIGDVYGPSKEDTDDMITKLETIRDKD